jgi:hypothetical protein
MTDTIVKIKVYLFYKDKPKPEVFEWDYKSRFHLDTALNGYLIMANENMKIPFCVICYKKGKYYSMLTAEKEAVA